MTTTSHYPDRVVAVRAHAAAGDSEALADELVGVAELNGGHWGYDGRRVTDVLDALPADDRRHLALVLLDRLEAADQADTRRSLGGLLSIVVRHLGTAMPVPDARRLLGHAARQWTYWPADQLAALCRVVRDADGALPGPAVAVLRRTVLTGWQTSGPAHDVLRQVDAPLLNPGEAWADRALADLPGLGPGWPELVTHALTASAARPSARWERRADALLEAVRPDAFRDTALAWLALVGRPRTLPLQEADHDTEQAYDPHNATALRGLVWLLALATTTAADVATARVLGGLVETSLRKAPGLGPRSPKVANAGVWALSRLDGEPALAQLARLAARVSYKGTLKEVNAALDRRATLLGLSRAEVEELAVPTYGLTEVGRRVERLGEVTAELMVDRGAATLSWRNAAGRPVRTAPAVVRRDHPEQLRELRAAAKDVEKMLSAQAERLDRQFLARRSWRFATWRSRYLDHPLVGTLGRRLIWLVDGVPCGFADGALRSVDDGPVTAADDAPVALWHPIGRDVAEVLAWRAWLERHAVVQPFKQAHREVYLLTAAEERTGVYSNRFAAHVLRQHQFHALAAVRGWRNRLRLMVDDSYPPAVRELPGWGLRAEFWVEGAGDEYGTDTTESGAYLRVLTDQLRFYPTDAPENTAHASGGGYEQWVRAGDGPVAPLPLERVPPLVLSEVMRDVDLFVGVASVGNDPTWSDGGPTGRYREYWQSYGFGELSATAVTRRDVLARLVPRLAVADRCRLEGRFLVVRGDLRSYKIHLGSGNILMSPNDEYLCIVPKQTVETGPGQVFLPFEGDRMLGVILSKALLLARDTAITDPTIVSQIRRG